MENFCINCDRKLNVINDTYPLWNKTTEKLCSKCRSKADFFLSWVYSQESAVNYYNQSREKLAEKGFWPRGLQHLEEYCKYLDKVDAPANNSSPDENTVKSSYASTTITQSAVDSNNDAPDNFIKSLFKSENTVAKILTVIALVIFILGFIWGIVIGFIILSNDDNPLGTVLSYWAGSFITGMVFIGFAEIIKLLQKISDKKE